MNFKTLSAVALVAAFAGNAFAETPTVVNDNFVSQKTRAEVRAELNGYKASGVNPWSIQYNPLKSFKSATTRAEVTAAYVADRDEVAAVTGEDSGSAYLASVQPAVRGVYMAGKPGNGQ